VASIEKQIEIKAPLANIWSLLMWERVPEWFTNFKKVEYTSKEKNHVGETVRITTEKGEMTATTLEMETNKKVAWRYSNALFTGIETFTLTEKKNGLILVKDVLEYQSNNLFLGEIFSKSLHEALELSFDVCLPKLKTLAEKNS